MQSLHRVAFEGAPDLVHVRRIARRLAQLLRFDARDEIKITAAVSELARAASSSGAGTVRVEFAIDELAIDELALEKGAPDPRLVVEVSGPGLEPAARARGTAAAEGVTAAEKLLERFAEAAPPDALRFEKPLPARTPAITSEQLLSLRTELKRMDPHRVDLSGEELQRQSRELAEALLDIEERKRELATLNAELSDTNRGVMALYAELDERATHLRRAGEIKTRFFSQMSHEFRTPLNSILALSDMLLEQTDGPLLPEQKRQVGLIRDGVADLLELVGDLLDLAKVDAGKAPIDVAPFAVGALFGALRAMIRPLLRTEAVTLEFGNTADLPPLVSDEAKVTQILRNFLSNAVKFTERGAIAVSARFVPAGDLVGGAVVDEDSVLFVVADTGIGVAPQHHSAIFEEFEQVENRLQRKSRGTGLGLPLCRRLAGLLGGRVWVESAVGHGATFYLLVPRVLQAALAQPDVRPRLLIVGENPERCAALGEAFRDVFLPVEASTDEITAARVAAWRPAAAIVDAASTAAAALETLRAAAVPLVTVPRAGEARVEQLVAEAYRAALHTSLQRVLIIDDDEAYRTILGRHLAPLCERVRATGSPHDGIAIARSGEVDCLVLDLIMPDVDGLELLQQIRSDAAIAHLPVVICSSKVLSAEEQALVRRLRAPFLPKDALAQAQIARALLDAQRLAPAVARDLAGSAA
jgi:signal transduction histidine kinase/CheY-like chemotaxis protein